MPRLSDFAASSLLAQAGGFEPQRKSNMALLIPGLPNGDTLILALKDVEIPGMDITTQNMKFFNTTVGYAGALTKAEDLTLTYRDFLDEPVLDGLSAWFRMVYNPATGAIGRARDYKRRGTLLLLPPGMAPSEAPGVVDTAEYRHRSWVCRGLFPTSLTPDKFDHDDEGTPAMINLKLHCDLCYPRRLDF